MMGREEADGLLAAARMMMVSARTAPKSRGIDDVITRLVTGEEELKELAKEMEALSKESLWAFFARDSENIRNSYAVLLIGIKETAPLMLDCGACGFSTCKEYWELKKKVGRAFSGPICTFKLIDLGIAIGSAIKTASLLNVDNRVMFSVGTAARKIGMISANICIGIPLSVSGKSLYFDR